MTSYSKQTSAELPKQLPGIFWYFIKPHWFGFLLMLIGAMGWGFQSSLFPLFIQLVIDKTAEFSVDRDKIFEGLGFIIFALIGIWVLIDIGFRAYDFAAARVLPKFQASIRMAFMNYSLGHSHRYFSDQFAGTIGSRISRMPEAMTQIIVITLTIFIPVVLAFCINSIILYRAKPIFGIISFAWFLIHFWLTFLFTRKCGVYSEKHSEALTALNGKIVDTIGNIMNVRLFSRKPYEMRYNGKFQTIEAKKNYQLLQYNALMQLCLGILSLVFFASMIILGVWAFQKEWISLGELALVFTSLNLMGLAWYMGMNFINFFKEIGTAREAMQLIKTPYEITDVPGAKALTVEKGKIVFDNVTFYYAPGRNLFKDKKVTLKAGEKVGLVGFSGSGKTTFVSLIMRWFDPISGRILIDGQNIAEVTQSSLRSEIALIPQDPSLFHRTLMDNIRYGRLEASDEEVIAASKRAHCHEFIQNLEEGYETLVGERGIKLSGGQRQRISIARAILKDAPILILDEATSSLDSMTEKYIQEALRELTKHRTTIVIAHRLSTLSDMDRILVFKEGQIVEEGSHTSLLALKGHYALLWSLQAGGFLPDTME
jgi:ATP-binding cassette subfamily B protein